MLDTATRWLRIRPMYYPQGAFAEACGTIRKCIEEKLIRPGDQDNYGATMRQWCENLPDPIRQFLGQNDE
jgi:hypothetical protein